MHTMPYVTWSFTARYVTRHMPHVLSLQGMHKHQLQQLQRLCMFYSLSTVIGARGETRCKQEQAARKLEAS